MHDLRTKVLEGEHRADLGTSNLLSQQAYMPQKSY